MMIFVITWIALLGGIGVAYLLMWFVRQKKEKQPNDTLQPIVTITLQDIITLASLNISADIHAMIVEHNLPVSHPDFYTDFQALDKQKRQLYTHELVEILSRDKRAYVNGLYEKYTGLNAQDVLLLLMDELHMENKVMARIMGLSGDALKKRKTRLKIKMKSGLLSDNPE